MFDIGWSELLLVALVTLVVMGPREIPRVLRAVRGAMAKVRSVSSDFQSAMDEAARSADLDDIKKEILKEQHDMSGDKLFQDIVGENNMAGDITKEAESAVNEVKAVSEMYIPVNHSAMVSPDANQEQSERSKSIQAQMAAERAADLTASDMPEDGEKSLSVDKKQDASS